jgi:hypothetical protein
MKTCFYPGDWNLTCSILSNLSIIIFVLVEPPSKLRVPATVRIGRKGRHEEAQ